MTSDAVSASWIIGRPPRPAGWPACAPLRVKSAASAMAAATVGGGQGRGGGVADGDDGAQVAQRRRRRWPRPAPSATRGLAITAASGAAARQSPAMAAAGRASIRYVSTSSTMRPGGGERLGEHAPSARRRRHQDPAAGPRVGVTQARPQRVGAVAVAGERRRRRAGVLQRPRRLRADGRRAHPGRPRSAAGAGQRPHRTRAGAHDPVVAVERRGRVGQGLGIRRRRLDQDRARPRGEGRRGERAAERPVRGLVAGHGDAPGRGGARGRCGHDAAYESTENRRRRRRRRLAVHRLDSATAWRGRCGAFGRACGRGPGPGQPRRGR